MRMARESPGRARPAPRSIPKETTPMRTRTSLLLLAPLALAAAALGSRAQSSFQRARLPGLAPVRYGLALDADRAFYATGDTLQARCTLANWSAEDVASWSLSQGGNGCNFSLRVVDAAEREVWLPGSIVQGSYS